MRQTLKMAGTVPSAWLMKKRSKRFSSIRYSACGTRSTISRACDPPADDRYRVTIFGSARTKPGSFAYEETKRAAAALAELGCDIITGGGPGLMQAANEGAAGSSGKGTVGRHPRRFAVRTGSQLIRQSGLRTPHVFHSLAPIRAHFRCIHRRAGRHRHRPGNDDDLATASSKSLAGHTAIACRPHVAWTCELGTNRDALVRSAAGQRRRFFHSAMRSKRRRGDRGDPRAPCQLAECE